MTKTEIETHRTRCCIACGCKYSDDHCLVVLGDVLQEGPCELCGEDGEGIRLVLTAIAMAGAKITPNPHPDDSLEEGRTFCLQLAEEKYELNCAGWCWWVISAEDFIRLYQQLVAWKIIRPEEAIETHG